MKYSRPLRVLAALIVIAVAVVGFSISQAHAQTPATTEPVVVVRDLTYWDAIYIGYVAPTRYEKWPLTLTKTENFTVTAESNSTGLRTLVILSDGSGNEIARATHALTTSQSAGNYFVQVQPDNDTGTGFYILTMRRVEASPAPTDTVTVTPVPTDTTTPVPTDTTTPVPTDTTPAPTDTTTVVPTETTPAPTDTTTAVPTDTTPIPTDTTTPAPTDTVTPEPTQSAPSASVSVNPASIHVGETAVVSVALNNVPGDGFASAEFTCTYDPALIQAGSIAASNLFGTDAALAIKDAATGSFIIAIAGSNGNKATVSGMAFTFNVQGQAVGNVNITCQVRVSKGDNNLITLNSTPAVLAVVPVTQANGTLNGQVTASKPVTVTLYDASKAVVATTIVNPDGTFSLSAPAGIYTVTATASGFLSASGSVTIASGEVATKGNATLLAGDIDGNNVIDQFDAMTIGMSYNTAEPAAADLNNDGVINVLDLEKLAANYRQTGPINWP